MFENIINTALYMIVLINPISKISILSSIAPETTSNELRVVSLKSSVAALGILWLFALMGNFILNNIFHVNINSFQIAGGIVLASIGFNAMKKGLFFETPEHQKVMDLSMVPLASPMIAGPSTITASVSFALDCGIAVTCISLFLAVTLNLILMLLSNPIGRFLNKFHIMGPLIRITGLIVLTIGIQMILQGATGWYTKIK